MDISKIKVVDQDGILVALRALNHNEDPTNWVLLGYEGRNEIVLRGHGTGGLEEFATQLRDDLVQFGILEVLVKGDEYNPVKHVFCTWIGDKVPAGLTKARAGAHREELLDLVKKGCAISAEYQTSKRSDVSYDPIAQSLTRMRATYHTSAPATQERQSMSRSHSQGGAQAKFAVADRAQVESALRDLFEERVNWVILAYVEGKRDEVELVSSGNGGVDELRSHYPTNRVYFCAVTHKHHVKGSTANTVTKFTVVTLIGPEVKPLVKAKSAGQRQDVTDFILSVCPVHGHFQPSNAAELTQQALALKYND